MVTFLDGPAKGASLALRRAPLFLRVTVEGGPHGLVDALDQPEDEPKPTEQVYVYRKRPGGPSGPVFVRPGGRYEMGEYQHVRDAPADELRETSAWRSWVERRAIEEGLVGE